MLTTLHPRWPEFEERLDRALASGEDSAEAVIAAAVEGSDCKPSDEGVAAATMVIWSGGCNGKRSGHAAYEAARAILAAMGESFTDTLGFLRTHGGYCDCEILFNVAERECAGPPHGCASCQAARAWLTDPRFSPDGAQRAYLEQLIPETPSEQDPPRARGPATEQLGFPWDGA